MYGLVNRAMHELIEGAHGRQTWERIKARAGVEVDAFLSLQTYPDALTVSLVQAASEELQTNPETLLRLFGEYWVGYAVEHGYRDLLQARGDSLFAFIGRLDDLHSRLSLVFPELRPPSFKAEVLSERRMRLHYISERDNLGAFVIGLLHGLAKVFGERLEVEQVAQKSSGNAHDEFLVSRL